MSKIKDEDERQWYINQNIQNAWNNVVLEQHIEMKLRERKAVDENSNRERLQQSSLRFLAIKSEFYRPLTKIILKFFFI